MRIEKIETFLIHQWLVVKVHTDVGITGIGEATFWAQPTVTAEIVHNFERYLVGKDPLTIDRHWLYLYRSSSFRGASIGSALSAIDVALWDIAGKHYEAPVHSLLGGRHREKIRMCALAMGDNRETIVETVTAALNEGLTAVKVDPLPPAYSNWSRSRLIGEVVGIIGAVREAVGNNVDICVELHRKLGPAEAISLAAKLEQFGLLFIEDPIPPDSIASMAEVARKVNVPIATGERLHTIYEFKEILANEAAHDLKLDVGLHGGITQCKKIAGLAEAYHSTISPHNAWGPVLTAAHVQLCASVPNFLILEYRQGNPPDNEVVIEPLKMENGYISVPDSPGIGVELNEEALWKHPFSPKEIDTATREDGSVAFR